MMHVIFPSSTAPRGVNCFPSTAIGSQLPTQEFSIFLGTGNVYYNTPNLPPRRLVWFLYQVGHLYLSVNTNTPLSLGGITSSQDAQYVVI